jgi:hypothetical protein
VWNDAKKKKATTPRAIATSIRQGIAPWRGMADVFTAVDLDFFFILGAANFPV